MNNMLIFLMPQSPDQSPIPSFMFLLLLIVVFYFFMIRPNMKRQKELKNYRERLGKGDKVVTTGGLYGKVTDVKDQTVTVEIAPNVIVKMDKNAILRDNTDLANQR